MSSKIRETAIYGAGSILSRIVSFLMLPVYTHYIDPAEYAKLALVLITVDVLGIAVSAGTTSGFMRYYFKAEEPGERRAVVSSALALNVGLNLIGSVILFAGAGPLASLVLSSQQDAILFRILAGCFLLEGFLGVPLLLMQAEKRPGLVVAMTLGRTALSAVLNLLFLIRFDLGVTGIVTGTLITHALGGIAGVLWTVRLTGWKVSRKAMRDLRRFGVPYQVAAAGSFILTFGDRYVLKASRTMAEVGIYAFGYQFGFLLWSVSAAPYFLMWIPERYRQLQLPPPERDAANARGFLYLNLIVVSVAVAIALAVRPVLALLTAQAYHAAATFVPVVLAAYLVQSWSEAFQFAIDVSERTRYATIAFWCATVVTIGLYVFLIPRYGPMGAAIATLLGYVVRFLLTRHFAERLTQLGYAWAPVVRLVGIAGLVVTAGQLLRPEQLSLEFVASSLLGLAYLGLVWSLVLTRDDRTDLVALLRQLLRLVRPALARDV